MIQTDSASLMATRGLRPVEGDIHQMKARFGITPEQEPAWNKFEEAVGQSMESPQADKKELPHKSVERAKFMSDLWRTRHERMQAVTATFKDLYELLDENQKKTADQRFGYCELPR